MRRRMSRGYTEMMLPLGNASEELADMWKAIARGDSDLPYSMELAHKDFIIYEAGEIPERAYMSGYISGDKELVELLAMLGVIEYPDEPYMLVSEMRFAKRPGMAGGMNPTGAGTTAPAGRAPRRGVARRTARPGVPLVKKPSQAGQKQAEGKKLDHAALARAGAHLIYDTADAPLEGVLERRGAYRFKGTVLPEQSVIDLCVYRALAESMDDDLREIRRILGLSAAGRDEEEVYRMSAMFEDGAVFDGENVRKILIDDFFMRAKIREELARMPIVLFEEHLASDGVVKSVMRASELYSLILYNLRGGGMEDGGFEIPHGMTSAAGIERAIRSFAEDEGIDSTIDAYNSGVSAEDLMA